jgi:dUTP pyrophosphatase
MTINIFEKTQGCMPEMFEIGDWIDLKTAEDITLKAPKANRMHRSKKTTPDTIMRDVEFDSALIPLGVIIQLPEGYEAELKPRSSTFKKWGIIQTNSVGAIDYTYRGVNDEWKLPVIATRNVTIPKGTRVCQFRIQLSQKATVWQKLKWLFSSSIKIKEIHVVEDSSRGGFGEGTKNK